MLRLLESNSEKSNVLVSSLAIFLRPASVFTLDFASNINHLVDVSQCVSKLELLKSIGIAIRAVRTLDIAVNFELCLRARQAGFAPPQEQKRVDCESI